MVLKANSILGCISKLREVINSFISALVRPHLDCYVLHPGLRDVGDLQAGKNAVKAIKVVRGPGHSM